MSVRMSGKYIGKKKVQVTHEPSGATITTAAPVDNQGDGSSFSPTDLVGASLGACMLTIMANVAERDCIVLDGSHFVVEKHMIQTPRKIGKLPIVFHLPAAVPESERAKLERAAVTCPVHRSLSNDVSIEVSYIYDL